MNILYYCTFYQGKYKYLKRFSLKFYTDYCDGTIKLLNDHQKRIVKRKNKPLLLRIRQG